MIKKLLTAAALTAALSGAAAHADTIDFSYLFSDGQSLTGSLTGTLSGGLVSDISNVQVTFNGTSFSGSLFAGAFAPSTGTWDYSAGAAVISTNASLNNFIFADSSDPNGNNVTNDFYFVNGTTPSGVGTQEVNAANGNVLTNNANEDNTALGTGVGTWTLKDVTPVPIPAAFPLLLSGLGLMGLRRRRATASLTVATRP